MTDPAAGRRCGGCGHAFHRDTCPRKGTSGCAPLLAPDGQVHGIACSRGRAPCPCPCPFGECHTCGAPIAGVAPFPLGSAAEIDVDRGSAGRPDGTLAIRQLPDGTLGCRRLPDGEEPGEGEYRGRAHVHQLG
jgi:hypothetical protein